MVYILLQQSWFALPNMVYALVQQKLQCTFPFFYTWELAEQNPIVG
jgi:hypothetical protein